MNYAEAFEAVKVIMLAAAPADIDGGNPFEEESFAFAVQSARLADDGRVLLSEDILSRYAYLRVALREQALALAA